MSSDPTILLPLYHYVQQEPADCLAACAAMVLAYDDIWVSYKKLLRWLKVEEHGARLSNLTNLEHLGLKAVVGRGTLTQLKEQIALGYPCIVAFQTTELPHWEGISGQHVVVVIGINTKSIYLHAPAFEDGLITVPIGDFDLAWLEQGELYAVLIPDES